MHRQLVAWLDLLDQAWGRGATGKGASSPAGMAAPSAKPCSARELDYQVVDGTGVDLGPAWLPRCLGHRRLLSCGRTRRWSQASAFAFMASNSCCVMAPESSSCLAWATWSAGEAALGATLRM